MKSLLWLLKDYKVLLVLLAIVFSSCHHKKEGNKTVLGNTRTITDPAQLARFQDSLFIVSVKDLKSIGYSAKNYNTVKGTDPDSLPTILKNSIKHSFFQHTVKSKGDKKKKKNFEFSSDSLKAIYYSPKTIDKITIKKKKSKTTLTIIRVVFADSIASIKYYDAIASNKRGVESVFNSKRSKGYYFRHTNQFYFVMEGGVMTDDLKEVADLFKSDINKGVK